jgi:hypothetical protein
MFNWVIVNPQINFFKDISNKCEKINIKLIAIYTSKLFPDIMPYDIPTITSSDIPTITSSDIPTITSSDIDIIKV